MSKKPLQDSLTPGDWLGLTNRVFAVTGAASGIGASIASELATAGALVALLDRDADALAARVAALKAEGATAIAVPCDVTDSIAVKEAAQRVRDELGLCSGLVNNAGMLRPGALDSVSLELWDQVLAVNLTGYLVCAREFAPQMRELGGGSIVHVASIAALNPQSHSGAYSVSKAGVLLLSQQMAAEWGPQGIRSNAVCPGMIRTPLSAKFYEEPGFEHKRAQVTASRRIGEPPDIAHPVLFLLSERAGYINGTEILVDGGMNTMLMDLVPRPGFNDL